jgi:branched-chain amino acid transport system substrate-binding protein
MAIEGIKKVVTCAWKYAAGDEFVEGFRENFTKAGGQIVNSIDVPFPTVEFQSALAEIASIKPDAVYAFYAGGGAAKFVKDYAAANLKASIPLWGPGFLTDGVEQAIVGAGDGVKTVLHYADEIDNPQNKAFRAAYQAATKKRADVYAVQGWDTMQLLEAGLKAVGGDVTKRDALHAAMSKATFASPRGPFKLSVSNNPAEDFYLREFRNGANVLVKKTLNEFADPGTGCKLSS